MEETCFSHQPLRFGPGATHRALAAGQCCGGRHGAGAQNRAAVSRVAASAPSAAGGQNRPPAGRRKRAANVPSVRNQELSKLFRETNEIEA